MGAGVGVAVGLAPYLGISRVRFFVPLLDAVPETLRALVVPVSASLMGILAIAVQYYVREKLSYLQLRGLFKKTLIGGGVCLLLLVGLNLRVVITVPYGPSGDSAVFIKGFIRPASCPCSEVDSDLACINSLPPGTAEIASCWGDWQIQLAQLSLIVAYLGAIGSFVILVAIVLIRDEKTEQVDTSAKRKKRPRQSKPKVSDKAGPPVRKN